ncbi:hypothetical protein AAC387_Pa06g3088 [Persea americana]
MAKLIGREFSRVLTTMRGTIGYLAPEWISGVAITAKADVHSYGMMLFEIISGKRNAEQLGDGEAAFFPCWAAEKIVEEEVLVLLDFRLDGITNIEELRRASRVACWCIQDNENNRPSMELVVQILEGVKDWQRPVAAASSQSPATRSNEGGLIGPEKIKTGPVSLLCLCRQKDDPERSSPATTTVRQSPFSL